MCVKPNSISSQQLWVETCNHSDISHMILHEYTVANSDYTNPETNNCDCYVIHVRALIDNYIGQQLLLLLLHAYYYYYYIITTKIYCCNMF
jgi:hypothetical protein